MAAPFDPLAKLASLGASVRPQPDAPEGERLRVLVMVGMSPHNRLQARRIAKVWERLILLQFAAGQNGRPRTVQQLLASGRLRVVNGRYVLPGSLESTESVPGIPRE
ncbi:MAG: hypothetical protein HDR50_06940 [Desulfovibrio sp.]|uniref:hypothetical protein n=1 Tax=Desulfovibrio sp. TaxID=885 RepID=UPI001A6716EF|nr:hypothetical protein [Desulfovibrio sp.]MBD5417384.1 hypothetical protein [Desulfovibrio sp.]